ncbi:MAG TPA: metallophosphoesterase family protein [Solimonas sp.]
MNTRRRLLQAGSTLLLPSLLQACGGSTAPDGIAPPPAPRNGPRGVHLSWTGDPRKTRTVTWFTDAVDDAPGVVEFGHDGGPMQIATATTEAAFDVPVTTHRATMKGFDPARPLRYRVRNGAATSPDFIVKPTPVDRFRFAHFGDHGRTVYARAVREGILRRGSDFFVIAGDLSYADGNQPVWDDWFNQMEHLAAQVPMMCCPGNHEDKDGTGAAFRTRFSHPGRSETFYSFDVGRVHLMVSTGGALITDGTLPAELVKIETDLATAALRRAAGEIDFIVFLQHFTIWTDEEGRSPANPTLVLLEENIMLRYGVDLLLVGHDHSYQRSQPMGLGLPLPFGYVQVCAGGGGQGMRTFDGFSAWSQVQQRRYSFVEYAVEPGRIVATTYAVDDGEDGPPTSDLSVIDEFELTPRPGIARHEAVKPIRDFQAILADAGAHWRYVEAHTKLRNAQHLHQALWHG